MENHKIKGQGSGQLFKSGFLERLTRTHIAVPVSLFIVYAIALLYWSIVVLSVSWIVTTLLFFAGLLAFTWVEYQVHKHLFHLHPSSERKKKIQYTIHGVHHEFPKDKDRLAMPPVLSITIATVLLLLLKVVIGDLVFAFLPGFLTGYAGYLSVHYILHVYPPPKNFFKRLWVHHSQHHYKNSKSAFGVSSPLWDYVYGTMP